ncbi:MAG: hypothetical protein M1824_004929 [Vezdaea acicularis]|nr:MAG: hypothetical protein M1824_004929 [Vezdaea acicularis]
MSYEELHAKVKDHASARLSPYTHDSFKFEVDTFQGKRSLSEQDQIIKSFQYLGLQGPIKMKDYKQKFCIFEEYDLGAKMPKLLHFGRFVASSDRNSAVRYSLKRRKYISTTSMDSELALISANITLAAPQKLFYDPFVGTGSFTVACAHFGAFTLGSDIDGRSIRGLSLDRNIVTNFSQYNLADKLLDNFVADLTHSPLRHARWIDGIICDPPYGVREGLKVLGTRSGSFTEPVFIDGKAAYLRDGYIPPKKPYSFLAMLDDILDFGANHLVDNGRLSFWMPTANDELQELEIPKHNALELVSVCVQTFNKWSRRLLTYRRLADSLVPDGATGRDRGRLEGSKANDLNSFRRMVFILIN